MKGLVYGSVCSGIEAVSIAWEPLGLRPAWFSEVADFPSRVLAHHWPSIPNLGDFTKTAKKILSDMADGVSAPAPHDTSGEAACSPT